jgi:hypothetical protein
VTSARQTATCSGYGAWNEEKAETHKLTPVGERQDMQELKIELQHSIARLESKLTIRMGTMLAASIAILTAIQKFI